MQDANVAAYPSHSRGWAVVFVGDTDTQLARASGLLQALPMARRHQVVLPELVPQDLHIHTTFSEGDSAVVPEQTVAYVAQLRYARVMGIADHLEFVTGARFERYRAMVRGHGLRLGVEVNGAQWVATALDTDVDYFIYHCYDTDADYRGAERLVQDGRPVIVAHPLVLGTDLDRIAPACLVEINNRYVWRSDWRAGFGPYVGRFGFVIGSDAHQPSWLNQTVARRVAGALGVEETILFEED